MMKLPPDVGAQTVSLFLRKLTREGPLGAQLTTRLEYSSAATRRFCGQLAAASGYHNLARNLMRW